MLHIDITILWTVINLLILYFLLKKFLFGRVHKILDEREAQIKKSYDDAAAVQQDADSLKAKYESQLLGADEEILRMKADARKEADAEYDRIVAEANNKSEEIIETAHKKAVAVSDREKQKAEESITTMVKEAAAKIVASQSDEQMYDVFLKEVEKENE